MIFSINRAVSPGSPWSTTVPGVNPGTSSTGAPATRPTITSALSPGARLNGPVAWK